MFERNFIAINSLFMKESILTDTNFRLFLGAPQAEDFFNIQNFVGLCQAVHCIFAARNTIFNFEN